MARPPKDFYLDERALAAYFEKDWFDQVLGAELARAPVTFAPFDPAQLYSDYHERLIDFLAAELIKIKAQPGSLLEVGSSLGRTYFEICRKINSLKSATLVEPSEHLASMFTKIFTSEGSVQMPVLKGNVDLSEVALDTRPIQAACAGVDYSLIQSDFQLLKKPLGPYDLTVCSNVIDQCQQPEALVELLKGATALSGVLVLTCTYQWQTKYIGNASSQIHNIKDLFGPEWLRLGETNIPFQVRGYERYWKKFLSHVVIIRREK